MLIINDNHVTSSLPVYEVQEVSVKEALALLKSVQGNDSDPLIKHVDSSLFSARETHSALQGFNSPSS